jgi:hypothetical protein
LRALLTIALLLAGGRLSPAQQGTADAIVVKIPAANIPSTVILSASAANGIPGQAVSVPIALAAGATAPGSFRMELTFDTVKLTYVSASGLSASLLAPGDLSLASLAVNPDGIAGGIVGSVSFTLAASFGNAATAIHLINCVSDDPSGNPLSTGCLAGTVGLFTCAVTGDAGASITDVQATIDQALGLAAPLDDMNRDGAVNVLDVQKVLAAAMGGSCLY